MSRCGWMRVEVEQDEQPETEAFTVLRADDESEPDDGAPDNPRRGRRPVQPPSPPGESAPQLKSEPNGP
jgi:hypothetical protein